MKNASVQFAISDPRLLLRMRPVEGLGTYAQLPMSYGLDLLLYLSKVLKLQLLLRQLLSNQNLKFVVNLLIARILT